MIDVRILSCRELAVSLLDLTIALPGHGQDWQLEWSDEFDGPSIDTSKQGEQGDVHGLSPDLRVRRDPKLHLSSAQLTVPGRLALRPH